jgi:hypothetical protein
MSKIALSGNASGTGTFTIASPDSNTNRTLNLPDAGGTVVLDSATQTLTNKTIQSSTIQGGTITSGTAVTASGTAVDFNGIPSWVKRITVMFSGVSTNGTSNFLVQLGDAGGIENTGYTGACSTVNGTTFNSTGYVVQNGVLAALLYDGVFTTTTIAVNTWVGFGNNSARSSNPPASTAGSKTLSATLDRIRITTVNGTDTFDAGTINILYEG